MKLLGTKIYTGTAGGAAATQIANITKFSGLPDRKFDKYDDSEVDQTSAVKQWEMTLADGGMIKIEAKMDYTRFAALLALADRVARAVKLLFSDASNFVSEGKIESVKIISGGGRNDPILVGLDIQLTKDWTLAAS